MKYSEIKKHKTMLFTSLIAVCLLSNCKTIENANNHSILGKNIFTKILKESLLDSNIHNVARNQNNIFINSLTDIKKCEPVLFSIYGKKQILKQRPYEAYLINDYWVIKGTLQENYAGGTFLIIINSKNGDIIRISHGK